MPTGDYLQGFAFLIATLTATGAVAVVCVRPLGLRGAPLPCALGTVWLTALLAAHLLPAAAGILTRETALLAAVLLAVVAYRLRRAGSHLPAPALPLPPSGTLSWVIAGVASVAVLGQVLLFLAERASTPVEAFDALTFHLPGVARWIQSGTIWQLDNLYPGYAFGNYPHNGDALQLTAVLPFGNDTFVRLVGYPLLLLTALSVYALACELRAPRAAAVTFAAALTAVPVAVLPALEEAQVDPLMFAAFGCGILFLARHARTGERSELVLAGLGLGVAFGTKWYALPFVLATLGLWFAGSLLGPRPLRSVAREGSLLTGLVLAGGGLWLVRNLVESSNPFFPQKIQLAGVTIFDAPRDTVREQIGFPLLHYLGDLSVFREYVLPSWADTFQSPGPLLMAGALAGVVVAAALSRCSKPELRPHRAMFCATLAVLLALIYAATPNSALGPEGAPIYMGAAARYAVPALMLGAVASAWAAGRLQRTRPLVELAALAATLDGLERTFDFTATGAVVAAATAAGLLVSGAWLRANPVRWRGRPAAVAMVAVLAVTALTFAGQRLQAEFNERRYIGADPVIDEVAAPGPPRRIAIAGTWSDRGLSPVLPAFGPRLDSTVEYVGPLVGGMLRRPRDPRDFTARLREGSYDLLLVGRSGPPPRTLREEIWARSEGFAPVAQSDRFTLLRPPSGAR